VLDLAYTAQRPVIPVMRTLMAASPQAEESTELQPGEQEVTVSVSSRWQFLSVKGK